MHGPSVIGDRPCSPAWSRSAGPNRKPLTDSVRGADDSVWQEFLVNVSLLALGLMGYPRINALESEFLLEEQIEKKYGGERPDMGIRRR